MTAIAASGFLPRERPALGRFILDLLTGIMLAVTHPATVRNTLANAVVDLLDAGTTAGNLVFQTSGLSEVATCPFADPAFGSASSGVASANSLTDDTNATGGTTDRFVAEDSDGTDVFLGSVTATGGGGDIELSSVAVGAGDTVGISTLTYAAAP